MNSDIKLSSYRLGDLVCLEILTHQEKNEIVNDYPDSIATEFINEIKNERLDMSKKIEIITRIALKHIEKYEILYPEDIQNSTLVHLRLGDAISGTFDHEIVKRPLLLEELEKLVPKNKKVYIIGKPFFAKTSSTNYEECYINSQLYLENALTILNGIHFDGNSADADLCCALKAQHFIEGKGFYSKLIVEIRKELKL